MSEDRLLVSRVLKGEARAFRELVELHQRLVSSMVGRLVRNTAEQEDLCQEIFMKVYDNLHRFNFRSRLSTWIARIAYLQAINTAKRQQNRRELPLPEDLPELSAPEDNPEQALDKKELATYLGLLIGELPFSYQTAINLYYLQEFSLAEITTITGVPEGTLKSHLSRARGLLKEKIRKHFKIEMR
ncbi:RNA polymerase sigma factor [Pedobacter nutrimenti]|uniref:RNA polymerase sigma factor n=1 Tax=Pedobacter nutrimenti TaxID=1241337 RepID=UPI002930F461|nr:sigma-70 family RNA polymerase sigma factor [Pedobacter nutrimenti]